MSIIILGLFSAAYGLSSTPYSLSLASKRVGIQEPAAISMSLAAGLLRKSWPGRLSF
jgi:hypothetical protein